MLKKLRIIDSKFQQNSGIVVGGSIYAQDISLDIRNSKFYENQASTTGGSVYLSCSIQNLKGCQYDIDKNEFKNNKADTLGGAIYYDLYSPLNLSNNTFDNNTSPYGPNVASYPFKLKVINSDQSWSTQLVSGQEITTNIIVGLFDQNDQLIVTDSSSLGTLTSDDLTIQISGNTKVLASKGVYNFSGIYLLAKPDYDTTLKFQSSGINDVIIKTIDKNSSTSLIVPIKFRKCVSGEVTYDNRCKICPRGYYSFEPQNSDCQICLNNAFCQGGDLISVNEGFWRSHSRSTKIYPCLTAQACLGGNSSDCAEGYEGKICGSCKKYVGNKLYGRSGVAGCQECSSLISQIFIIIGIVLFIMIYAFYIQQQSSIFNTHSSVMNKPKRNKPQTVLLRILTNYAQVVMLVKDFELQWPEKIKTILDAFSFISSSQQNMLSFDCIYQQMNFDVPSTFYIQVGMFGVLPIALSILGATILTLMKLTCKRNSETFDLKQNIIVNCFVFIFILYPQITSTSFGLFNCVNYEDGDQYLRRDINIKCWKGDHLKFSLIIGLPIILAYAFFFPAIIFWRIKLGISKLKEADYLQRYGLFYVGLNDNTFYWELVFINMRKLVFIFCGSVLSTYNQEYKVRILLLLYQALIGIVVLFAQVQFATFKDPFIDHRFNTIDFHGTYAAVRFLVQIVKMAVLFGGIFFIKQEASNDDAFLTFLFVVILVYNLTFILYWLKNFLMVFVRSNQNLIRRFSILKCLRLQDYEEELETQRSKIEVKKKQRTLQETTKQGERTISQLNLGGDYSYKTYEMEKKKQNDNSFIDGGYEKADDNSLQQSQIFKQDSVRSNRSIKSSRRKLVQTSREQSFTLNQKKEEFKDETPIKVMQSIQHDITKQKKL